MQEYMHIMEIDIQMEKIIMMEKIKHQFMRKEANYLLFIKVIIIGDMMIM